jgi:hypothetical protein
MGDTKDVPGTKYRVFSHDSPGIRNFIQTAKRPGDNSKLSAQATPA